MQNTWQNIAPMSMNTVGAPMQPENSFGPSIGPIVPTYFNGNTNANVMLESMHQNFVPTAVNSSPPRPPFAPVRGIPYDAHAMVTNRPEQKTQESLGDLVQEIRSIQEEISTLCDGRGDTLVPRTNGLFTRIGHLEERNLLLKQHQEQLLNSSQAVAQAQDGAHETQPFEAVRRAQEQERKIRELEILLDQAEKKATSMQNNESMLEAQLRNHEQRFAQLEEEAIRIKHSRVVSQVASDEAVMAQVSMVKKELGEMEVRARRREEDFRVLLQEKQLELDRMKTRMSEQDSSVLKREADGEQEVTSLVAHVQSLEETNRMVEKEKAQLQQQGAHREHEVTSLVARVQLLEETNRTVDQAREELQQLVANQQEQVLRGSEDNHILRATIAEQQDEIARLKYHFSSVEDALQERESALETVGTLNEVIKQRDEQLSVLQRDLEITRFSEQEGNNAMIAELVAQGEKASSENRFLTEQGTRQRELIDQLTEEKENAKEDGRTLQANLARDKAQIMELEAELDRLLATEKDYVRQLAQRTREAEVALEDQSNRAAQMARRQSDRERELTQRIQELQEVKMTQEDKMTQEELPRPSQVPSLQRERSLPERISADKHSIITNNYIGTSNLSMPRPPGSSSSSSSVRDPSRLLDSGVSGRIALPDVARNTTSVDTAAENNSVNNPNASVGVPRVGSVNERGSSRSVGALPERGSSFALESVSTGGIGSLQNTENIPEVYMYAFDVIEKFGWDSLRAKDTWTPLHWAAYENRADVCSWLLARGANPHLPDEKGKSALAYAMERANADAVEVLSRGLPSFTA